MSIDRHKDIRNTAFLRPYKMDQVKFMEDSL